MLIYMGRPKIKRCNCCKPSCNLFKPDGRRKGVLSGVKLESDEFTALKLHDVDGLNQKEASFEMKVSQPTFARILSSGRHKIASAIIKGEEIRIN